MAAKDVMVDIETLALDADALVLSIGVIPFDCVGKDGPWFGESFLAVPNLTEQIMMGRTIETSTQTWWGDPEREAASLHWRAPPKQLTVRSALAELSGFIREAEAPRVWANGAVFDIGILNSLYAQCGMKVPWKYNAVRDARTLYDVLPKHPDRNWCNPEKDGPLHHPVVDCRVQIIRMWEHGWTGFSS